MLSAIQDHWLAGATHIPSPNCDDRPDSRIDLLVIHCISLPPGRYGGPFIAQLFTNRLDAAAHPYFQEIVGMRVSAHLLIRRDGSLLQFVPFNKRAWHAGESCFCGEQRCNDFSIGIELEGTDEEQFAPVQYERLAEVTRALMQAYPGIVTDRIAGHSEIAPGRKSDPGPGFDWHRYRRLLVVAEG